MKRTPREYAQALMGDLGQLKQGNQSPEEFRDSWLAATADAFEIAIREAEVDVTARREGSMLMVTLTRGYSEAEVAAMNTGHGARHESGWLAMVMQARLQQVLAEPTAFMVRREAEAEANVHPFAVAIRLLGGAAAVEDALGISRTTISRICKGIAQQVACYALASLFRRAPGYDLMPARLGWDPGVAQEWLARRGEVAGPAPANGPAPDEIPSGAEAPQTAVPEFDAVEP